MRFHTFKNQVIRKIGIKSIQKVIIFSYLLSTMVSTRKHSQKNASLLSGIGRSVFCKLLQNKKNIIAVSLENLSKKESKRLSKVIQSIGNVPYKVLILIDSTLQNRCSLKSENVQRFNHGKGFIIGHQWTNIVLFFNGILIPLKPIPFYSKKYCRKNGMTYATEHKRVTEYIKDLNLSEYLVSCKDSEVAVLTDSGYDDKKIQNIVLKKGWTFVGALKSSRGVRSESTQNKSQNASGWDRVSEFFRKNRRIGWETIRIFTEGPKRKRKEFRVRHTEVILKEVRKVRVVCSEFQKKGGGSRKYIACSDLKLTPVQILKIYRLRWKIEIFHKEIKMYLGFGDVAAKHFSSVESHVYFVYCAYILMQSDILESRGKKKTIAEKQQEIMQILKKKEIAGIVHELTKIHGVSKVKSKLKSELAA